MREENKFLSLLRFDGKFLSASTKGRVAKVVADHEDLLTHWSKNE
jgi:hypothetical protein